MTQSYAIKQDSLQNVAAFPRKPARAGLRVVDAAPRVADASAEAVTVVVAVDHFLMGEGFRLALEHHGFDVVAQAGDAKQAVTAARRHRPSLCLLATDLPGNGIRAAARIHRDLPETKIAMLASSADQDEVSKAVDAGADGYLLKRLAPDRLAGALRGLRDGQPALPPAFAARLVRSGNVA